MQRWNWFISADYQGKWITTKGYAEVLYNKDSLSASLRFGSDSPIYHQIEATIDSDNYAKATVTSPEDKEITPFRLSGYVFKGGQINGVESVTIFLTDGTTMLGLTYGPLSNEDNL